MGARAPQQAATDGHRQRAEEFLRRTLDQLLPTEAADLDHHEAALYLASRGYDVREYVDRIRNDWKDLEANEIERCKYAFPDYLAGRDVSPRELPHAYLRDFWTRPYEMAVESDAAIFRVVEWCEIGGFEAWLVRLARSANAEICFENALQPGIWAFVTSRSNSALRSMRPALSTAFHAGQQYCADGPPWRVQASVNLPVNHRLVEVTRIDHAAHLLFVSYRLGIALPSHEMQMPAIELLLKKQRADGAWPMELESDEPCIETTAAAMHALGVWKPHGYQRAMERGAKWLESMQQSSGEWSDATCPSPGYATVLVLDAMDLAEGRTDPTFDCPATRPNELTLASADGGVDRTKSRPKRRGRKKAAPETEQRESQLAADWVRAREAGVQKCDFAKEHGMTMKELDKLLDRVGKRKARSDK